MTRSKDCSEQKGCSSILIHAPERTGDVYPQTQQGKNIPLQSTADDFLKVATNSESEGSTIQFTEEGCYGFGLWCNLLPTWVLNPVFYDTIRQRIIEGIDNDIFDTGVTEDQLDSLSPTTNPEDARTVLAHYVFALIIVDGVSIQDLDTYLSPATFRLKNDLLLFVRVRDGKEELVFSTYGTKERINQDSKAQGPLNTVQKIRESYLGAPILTEHYYHVENVQKGDKFVFRSRRGTFRFSKEKISTGGDNATVMNLNSLSLHVTEICSKSEKKCQKDKCQSTGIVYFLGDS